MAERQSLGPLQISDLTIAGINDALRQIQERLDDLKGLGGDTTIHAGLTTDSVRVTDSGDHLVHGLGATT